MGVWEPPTIELSPMLTNTFERLFRRLLTAFLRYDDTPRDIEHVIELAATRAALEDLRRAIAEERQELMGLGRSRVREDWQREQEEIARLQLFTIANTSN